MKRFSAFLILLVLTSLACQMPIRAISTQTPTLIPVSTEAVGQMENQMATAAAELEQTGQVTVTFTETQLTSYFAQQLSTSGEMMLTDPQVILANDTIEVTGTAAVGKLKSNTQIILEPYADQGNLRMTILEAKFGKLPVPDAILKTLTNTLNQNLDNLTSINGQKFWLETIEIADGTMTLSGRLT